MNRKILEDFRFSDGTLLPKGSWVAVPNRAIHVDKVIPPVYGIENRHAHMLPEPSSGSGAV
jgi:hypothetical protein